MALALLAGNLHRDLTLRGEAVEVSKQIQQKTQDHVQRLKQHALQFVVILRSQPGFRKNFPNHDWKGLSRFLASQYDSPLFSSGVLDIVQVNVYDDRLRLKSRANKPGEISSETSPIDCGAPLYIGRKNQRTQAMIVEQAVCAHQNRLYFTAAIPVEAGATTAHLEIVADLAYNLELLEEDIGMPLRAQWGRNAAAVYQSPRWPTEEKLKHMALASYDAPLASQQPELHIEAARDLVYLSKALHKADLTIIVGTSVVTVVVILVMLTIAKHALLGPVSAMIGHIRNVRLDKSRLKEKIVPRGTVEIRELAENFNDLSAELKKLYRTLEDSALTDALTRLGNRKQFHANLSCLANPAERRTIPFALLMIDLDKFKQINDTLGHKAGDQFLSQIGERFLKELRDTDCLITPTANEDKQFRNGSIARIGGDEFAVLLPQIDSEEKAIAVAKKLAATANAPFVLGETTVRVGLSIGIALYPKHTNDKDALIHKADVAMYQAKKAGGGYAVYAESMELVPTTGRAA